MTRYFASPHLAPLLLLLLQLLSPSTVALKLGSCPTPPPDAVGTCDEACKDDESCPGEQKCCSNGCGHGCVEPLALHPVDPLPDKPGECRYVNTALVRCSIKAAIDECKQDWQCPGKQKCCNVGCKLKCSKPVKNKHGFCPYVDTRLIKCAFRPDLNKCQQDWQCPGKEKCCSSGCAMICTQPVKAGSCPVRDFSHIVCIRYNDGCKSDDDCPDKQKCCSVPCGVGCVAPEPEKDQIGKEAESDAEEQEE
ncbi:WAP four-disulfide core domain protein 8-like [Lampetra planeri]